MECRKIFIFLLSLTILSACSSKKHLSSTVSNKVIKKYSTVMEVSPKKITNGKLYNFIDQWEGTKHRTGGLDKNGIDCSGFTYLLYRDVYGKPIPRNTSQQVQLIKRRYENQLKEGDLVFFNYNNKKNSHVGVFLQNGYYVHASTRRGVVVQKLRDPYTYKYFSRGGSVK